MNVVKAAEVASAKNEYKINPNETVLNKKFLVVN